MYSEDELHEFAVRDKNSIYNIGDIYVGYVTKIEKGLNCAFVNLGLEKYGYLKYSEMIDEQLKISNSSVLVQIKKKPKGEKGIYISQKIEIKGNNMILFLYDSKTYFSKKIISKKDKDKLKKIKENIFAKDFGILFRHTSIKANYEELVKEANELKVKAGKLLKQTNILPIPREVLKERETYKKWIDKYKVEDENIFFKKNITYDDELLINSKNKILKYDLVFLKKQIRTILDKEVLLSNGASIILEKTEALYVIDVNSKSIVKNSNIEITAVVTNEKVLKAISNQIKFRNISGIILIDFIDMKSELNKEKICDGLSNYFNLDTSKTKIIDITKLGIMEITRERLEPSIYELENFNYELNEFLNN